MDTLLYAVNIVSISLLSLSLSACVLSLFSLLSYGTSVASLCVLYKHFSASLCLALYMLIFWNNRCLCLCHYLEVCKGLAVSVCLFLFLYTSSLIEQSLPLCHCLYMLVNTSLTIFLPLSLSDLGVVS